VPITYVLGPWNDPKGHGGSKQHMHIETTDGWECVPVGHYIESLGGRVAEHPDFGGVCTTGCHNGQAHYQGRAIDVNLGYGNPPGEQQFLERLRTELARGLDVSTLEVPGRSAIHVPIRPSSSAQVEVSDMTDEEHQLLEDLHASLPMIRDVHAALLSPDAKDPGLVHRVKNGIEPRVRALDSALLSSNPDAPGVVHTLKNETVKLVWRMAGKLGVDR
jgi:hypothetical protein